MVSTHEIVKLNLVAMSAKQLSAVDWVPLDPYYENMRVSGGAILTQYFRDTNLCSPIYSKNKSQTHVTGCECGHPGEHQKPHLPLKNNMKRCYVAMVVHKERTHHSAISSDMMPSSPASTRVVRIDSRQWSPHR